MGRTSRKVGETIKLDLDMGGQSIPVKIYYEVRKNVRFSLTGTAAHLRFPYNISTEDRDKQWNRFQDWLKETLAKNDKLQNHLLGRKYEDGSELQVGKCRYKIRIKQTTLASHKARLLGGSTILLELNPQDQGHSLQKSIRQLISRCVSNHRLPEISERVHHFNDLHFNKLIQKITFKLNQTNWGSCSSRKNLNFSSRLLFAPDEVIDYVIVHELAHLIEMNHSSRFWALVENVIPDYKEKEEWLRLNSHHCNF